MCGRFSDLFTWEDVLKHYRLIGTPLNLEPSYNVCPTDTIGTVVARDGKRVFERMRWGIDSRARRGTKKIQAGCLIWKTLPSGSQPSHTLAPSNSHSHSTTFMVPPNSAARLRAPAMSSVTNTSLIGVSSRRSRGVAI